MTILPVDPMIIPLVGGVFNLPEPDCERTPSCSDWILGRSEAIPNHFCSFVAYWSVQKFLHEWGFPHPLSPAYLRTWPLPVGQRALNMWYDHRLPLEIPGGPLGERLTLLARSVSFYEAGGVVRTPAQIAIMTHCLSAVHPLATLITDPDAWLIAAVSRRLSAGRVWLLIPGKLAGTAAIEYEYIAGTGDPNGVWYGWDVNGQEEIIFGRGDGSMVKLLYNWLIGFPYVITASVGGGDEADVFGTDWRSVKLKPLGELHKAAYTLAANWIGVSGGRLRGGGPVRYFLTKDECETAVVAAIRHCLRAGRARLQERVAEQLGLTNSGLRWYLDKYSLAWEDLVAAARR